MSMSVKDVPLSGEGVVCKNRFSSFKKHGVLLTLTFFGLAVTVILLILGAYLNKAQKHASRQLPRSATPKPFLGLPNILSPNFPKTASVDAFGVTANPHTWIKPVVLSVSVLVLIGALAVAGYFAFTYLTSTDQAIEDLSLIEEQQPEEPETSKAACSFSSVLYLGFVLACLTGGILLFAHFYDDVDQRLAVLGIVIFSALMIVAVVFRDVIKPFVFYLPKLVVVGVAKSVLNTIES